MKRDILVTGGAGFIGSNLVDTLLHEGQRVTVFDALLRPGSEKNLAWLKSRHPDLRFIHGDVRDADAVRAAAMDADVIYHLAGQVAVTSSVTEPRTDFEINALGTFNVLEAARRSQRQPIVVFTSTNKVYGGMEDVVVEERPDRYEFRDRPHGIPEDQPLDFHSPYGCSKGAADQYVRDYARIYGLRDGRLSHELHLRPAAVRQRRSGLAGPLHDRGADRQADHHLRRRQAGARRALRRGPGARRSGWRRERSMSRPGRYSTSAAGRRTRSPSGRSSRDLLADSRARRSPSASATGGRATSPATSATSARPSMTWAGVPESTSETGIRRLWEWVSRQRAACSGRWSARLEPNLPRQELA